MIISAITAFFLATIPVGIFSFLLLGWALKKGKLKHFSSRAELKEQMEQLKAEKKEKKEKGEKVDHNDFFINKWMTFGGGFYGTMAFFTYVIIETKEVIDFITDLNKIAYFFSHLGFELLVQFLINSVMNFISAIIWFVYWATEISHDPLIWLVMAYLGFYLGSRYVPEHSPALWPLLKKWRDNGKDKATKQWEKVREQKNKKDTPP